MEFSLQCGVWLTPFLSWRQALSLFTVVRSSALPTAIVQCYKPDFLSSITLLYEVFVILDTLTGLRQFHEVSRPSTAQDRIPPTHTGNPKHTTFLGRQECLVTPLLMSTILRFLRGIWIGTQSGEVATH
jgi:hypothetical protein